MWLLIGPTLAAAQEGPDRFRAMLDSVAPGLLAEHEVAGLVIAYLHDGVPVLTTGYGFVDPSSGQAMTASTPLNVASLSKAVTAWGVLGLVADGDLALGQPVNERLTRWRLSESDGRSRQVTIGRLLSHTAGLNVPSVPMVPLNQSNVTLEATLSGEVDGTAVAIVQEPGASWQYSGGGYTVLELLVEEVSGQRFDDFMRATVFGPNLMTASTFSPTDDEIRATMGTDSNGNSIAPYRVTGAAAGGLMTDAVDMSHFLSGYFEIADDGTTRPSEMATQLLRAPTAKVTIQWCRERILRARSVRSGFRTKPVPQRRKPGRGCIPDRGPISRDSPIPGREQRSGRRSTDTVPGALGGLPPNTAAANLLSAVGLGWTTSAPR
ncbi:MAG: serine hydrolase [Gemmatimonadota bacterium]|nr:serine hydrolase [Gemmatimonadota bacterium]